MDTFMNLAKQGYQAYESSQQSHQQSNDDGNVQDRRHHESPGYPDVDHEDVVRRAAGHAGDSEESSFFSSALNHAMSRKDQTHESIDEEHVTNSHREAYEKGNAGNLDSNSMGAAAAMQALKMFTQGGHSGGGQSQLISLAMSEATKLFNDSGKSSASEKQDTINSATMTMMKLVVQSKFSGSGILGGDNKGGIGSILGMAQKFL